MPTKYYGSINTLKNAIISASIPGEWQSDGSKHTFRSRDGGILNWWPSSGTVQFQGKEPDKTKLQRILHNCLAETEKSGHALHHDEGSTYAPTAGSEPPVRHLNGQGSAVAFKTELAPLLRDIADVFAKQKLVLVMVNGVPRIVQEQGHSVTSTIETKPPAHISRY